MLTNYPSLDGTNTFTGTNTFSEMVLATNANNIFNGTFSGDGSGLTGIPSLSGANTFVGDTTFAGNSSFTGSSTFDHPFLNNPNIEGGRLFFPQIEDARFQGISWFDGPVEINGGLYAQYLYSQNINAQTITGDGSGLTGLNPANLTGTLADTQLSANVALLSGTNAFTGTNTFSEMVLATNANNIFSGAFSGIFSGNGAGVTNISWTNLATPPPGMVLIPAGLFTMGDMLDGEDDAAPMDIYVSAFYMDVNLVNLSQWQSVYFWATDHGYDFANSGAGKAWNHPVQTLDWYDMVKWCNARSQQAGKPPVYYVDPDFTQIYTSGEPEAIYPNWAAIGYRLPTESEWEKAARGGLSAQRFPWGNVITENLACYNASTDVGYDLGPVGYNPAFTNGVTPYTSPVGSFAPNGYGLFDMAGNVAELCWDWYGTPFGQPSANNPTGPASGESHIQRGGDWGGNASGCRSAFRSTIPSNVANPNSGFRTVLP
jgi:formylglycine-generating enzyme required for sulfatase activity